MSHKPGPWTIIPRQARDIPGSGSRGKHKLYCVYRAGQYHSRHNRRQDALAAIAKAEGK